MDAHRFDAYTRTIGRRGLAGAALGVVAPALLAPRETAAQVNTCGKQKGVTCRRDEACCSGRCKKKNGQKKGECRCSKLRKPCFDNLDCCGDITGLEGSIVCSDHDDFSEIVCCVSITGPCQISADCCSDLACLEGECKPPEIP